MIKMKSLHVNLNEDSLLYSWFVLVMDCFLSSLCLLILSIKSVRGIRAANPCAAHWMSVLMFPGMGSAAIIIGASLGNSPVMFYRHVLTFSLASIGSFPG